MKHKTPGNCPFNLIIVSCERSCSCQIYHAPQDTNEKIPLRHHHLLCAQLPRRIPQPRRDIEVRKQEHHHQTVQLQSAPLLATQLHGCLHMELTVRWSKE